MIPRYSSHSRGHLKYFLFQDRKGKIARLAHSDIGDIVMRLNIADTMLVIKWAKTLKLSPTHSVSNVRDQH